MRPRFYLWPLGTIVVGRTSMPFFGNRRIQSLPRSLNQYEGYTMYHPFLLSLEFMLDASR
jgi:hypothetical protein